MALPKTTSEKPFEYIYRTSEAEATAWGGAKHALAVSNALIPDSYLRQVQISDKRHARWEILARDGCVLWIQPRRAPTKAI